MAHHAETLKIQGNDAFKDGDFSKAEILYTQAITRYSQNPLLFTNRANVRLKLQRWEGAIDDCIHSIDLMPRNTKAYFCLAQAQLAMHRPNVALSSATTAYDLCLQDPKGASSTQAISALIMKCKREKWNIREKERLRARNSLLGELEELLTTAKKAEAMVIDERFERHEIGRTTATEEKAEAEAAVKRKIDDLRSIFAIADPLNVEKREVPDYLLDDITFEIMHDPVVTKQGHSYERNSLLQHLKRNPTDPLTREPLSARDLRPNLALKKVCEDFLENNAGWVVDW